MAAIEGFEPPMKGSKPFAFPLGYIALYSTFLRRLAAKFGLRKKLKGELKQKALESNHGSDRFRPWRGFEKMRGAP